MLARRSGTVSWGLDDAETAKRFIEWIEQMNASMGIPTRLSGIKDEDISLMARHANQEANPLYPVPLLMSRRELEKIYYAVQEK